MDCGTLATALLHPLWLSFARPWLLAPGCQQPGFIAAFRCCVSGKHRSLFSCGSGPEQNSNFPSFMFCSVTVCSQLTPSGPKWCGAAVFAKYAFWLKVFTCSWSSSVWDVVNSYHIINQASRPSGLQVLLLSPLTVPDSTLSRYQFSFWALSSPCGLPTVIGT